jgi:hypothetical protein
MGHEVLGYAASLKLAKDSIQFIGQRPNRPTASLIVIAPTLIGPNGEIDFAWFC